MGEQECHGPERGTTLDPIGEQQEGSGWSRGRELSGRTAERVGFWWALAGHWKDPVAEYDLSGSLSDVAVFSYRYLNQPETLVI